MIFSFAATLEVKNADIAFLNRDAGRWGLEIVHRIDAAPTFGRVLMVDGPEALRSAIDTQKAIAAVHIGQTFSRDIEAGAPADLQIILDGRKSNASQIVAGYLTQIVNGVAAETQPADARPPPRSATSPATGLIQT